MTLSNDFWDDSDKARDILKEIDNLKKQIKRYESLLENLDYIIDIVTIEEDYDLEFEKEIEIMTSDADKSLEDMRVMVLLGDKYDKNDAILSIHPGSGGLDSQDFAEMILRMYTKYLDKMDFSYEMTDLIKDTEAGIKSASMRIKGRNAYGLLKSEKGVHRLVRISPFNSSNKRHTSFVAVDILPILEDDQDINIDPADIQIDTYRASGAGGQHVNTTDSAVRIKHLKTNIVVTCQSERSQIKNRATAMKMLMAKLIDLKELQKKEKIEDLSGDYSEISWGSQIRSYVFHPYQLIKDHRTNYESSSINDVLDGNINDYISEYLKFLKANK